MDNTTMSKQINGMVKAEFLKDIDAAYKAIGESTNKDAPAHMFIPCSECDGYYDSVEDNEPCEHLKKVFSKL